MSPRPRTPWPRLNPTSSAPAAGWVDQAACHNQWHLFDDPTHALTSRQRAEQLAEARAICDRCPVRRECAEFASTARPRVSGIWAGRRRYPTSTEGNSPA